MSQLQERRRRGWVRIAQSIYFRPVPSLRISLVLFCNSDRVLNPNFSNDHLEVSLKLTFPRSSLEGLYDNFALEGLTQILFLVGKDEGKGKNKSSGVEGKAADLIKGTSLSPLERWELSLMASTSLSQLFMHLFTLGKLDCPNNHGLKLT